MSGTLGALAGALHFQVSYYWWNGTRYLSVASEEGYGSVPNIYGLLSGVVHGFTLAESTTESGAGNPRDS
jgi:hypothetical protein